MVNARNSPSFPSLWLIPWLIKPSLWKLHGTATSLRFWWQCEYSLSTYHSLTVVTHTVWLLMASSLAWNCELWSSQDSLEFHNSTETVPILAPGTWPLYHNGHVRHAPISPFITVKPRSEPWEFSPRSSISFLSFIRWSKGTSPSSTSARSCTWCNVWVPSCAIITRMHGIICMESYGIMDAFSFKLRLRRKTFTVQTYSTWGLSSTHVYRLSCEYPFRLNLIWFGINPINLQKVAWETVSEKKHVWTKPRNFHP